MDFFNCGAFEQRASNYVFASANFQRCSFEFGAVPIGLFANSVTLIEACTFEETGCGAVPGRPCDTDGAHALDVAVSGGCSDRGR